MLELLHLAVINFYYYSFLVDIGKCSRETASHPQEIFEVTILKLQYKISSSYKVGPHECLKSIQDKKNNIIAKNEEKDLPTP